MKNIKVYLQYPWKTSDSQYYKSLVDNPPENVEYVSEKMNLGMIVNKRDVKIRTFIKKYLRKFLVFTRISIPNLQETKTKKEYDLIHCAHCLSKNNSPWVADFENVWQMWVLGNKSKKSREKIKNILLNKNCKKIIAWTEASKKEIIEKFPEIEKKVDVVTYAMPFPKSAKKRNKKKITLLFIGRYFYWKGGLHILKVFDNLTKRYKNVEAIFISDCPRKIINEYKNNNKIKILGLTSHKKIIEDIFPNADLFVYPGYTDSFGFTFIESLAFGVPVITVNGFARKDIIEDKKTGYVVEKPKNLSIWKIEENEEELIQKMVNKTSLLIENKKLREKMSKKCIEAVKSGKFSIKERNKKLKRIYEEALK
jgi:glycosyltransferase involved in cell wall biosynthesis